MKTIFTAILILALSGCGPKPASDKTDAGPDVNAMWTEFAASLNAGDAERWLASGLTTGCSCPQTSLPLWARSESGTRCERRSTATGRSTATSSTPTLRPVSRRFG
jgi:hypothetical protein